MARQSVMDGNPTRACSLFRDVLICHRDDPNVAVMAALHLFAAGKYLEALPFCAEAIARAPDDRQMHVRFFGAAFKVRGARGMNDRSLAATLFALWASAYAPDLQQDRAAVQFATLFADGFMRMYFLSLIPPDATFTMEVLRPFDTVQTFEASQSHDAPDTYDSIHGNQLTSMLFAPFVHEQLPSSAVYGLEFGVGTGLLRKYLPPGLEMTGVDLSPGMIEHAADKGYSRLVIADICAPLNLGTFDFVLSIGTMLFWDNLLPIFRNAGANLTDGGSFLFSCCACSDSVTVAKVSNIKYAHSKGALERMARDGGFEVAEMRLTLEGYGPAYYVHLRKVSTLGA